MGDSPHNLEKMLKWHHWWCPGQWLGTLWCSWQAGGAPF